PRGVLDSWKDFFGVLEKNQNANGNQRKISFISVQNKDARQRHKAAWEGCFLSAKRRKRKRKERRKRTRKREEEEVARRRPQARKDRGRPTLRRKRPARRKIDAEPGIRNLQVKAPPSPEG